jgi:aconitate hydratase
VLSGNRNFEGRITPDIRANYLASPPLVVAYASPAPSTSTCKTSRSAPTATASQSTSRTSGPPTPRSRRPSPPAVSREQFTSQYADVFAGSAAWQAIHRRGRDLYTWDDKSTYIQEPPFFVGISPDPKPIASIIGARVLLKLGDSVTTDHISPAGSSRRTPPPEST